MAIKMHSRTADIQKLRHDLRNGPSHVFGDHSKCNPDFYKHAQSSSTTPPLHSNLDNEHGISSTDDPDHDFSEMIDTIIAVEESDNPSTSEEANAQTGRVVINYRPPCIIRRRIFLTALMTHASNLS